MGFVSHIIDEVSSIYSIDLDRVYVTGFSNGGYLAYEIACLLSNRIAGIGSVAGHMFIDTYNYCDPSHPTPLIIFMGQKTSMKELQVTTLTKTSQTGTGLNTIIRILTLS